ncbi:hypothetical protein CALCODRAFT_125623 [Calocera cornea HHB12733]|uniref:Uncharacterized protein n=1 Tax=Calocera cornea HHB12733 TaxID=1353952 RepID=A0A165CWZ4_9BASI|nr:hypothetical protein CALCODRAFT_125623 [Calocera cornea HHB12733]
MQCRMALDDVLFKRDDSGHQAVKEQLYDNAILQLTALHSLGAYCLPYMKKYFATPSTKTSVEEVAACWLDSYLLTVERTSMNLGGSLIPFIPASRFRQEAWSEIRNLSIATHMFSTHLYLLSSDIRMALLLSQSSFQRCPCTCLVGPNCSLSLTRRFVGLPPLSMAMWRILQSAR